MPRSLQLEQDKGRIPFDSAARSLRSQRTLRMRQQPQAEYCCLEDFGWKRRALRVDKEGPELSEDRGPPRFGDMRGGWRGKHVEGGQDLYRRWNGRSWALTSVSRLIPVILQHRRIANSQQTRIIPLPDLRCQTSEDERWSKPIWFNQA